MSNISRSPQRHSFLNKKSDGQSSNDLLDQIRNNDLLKEEDTEWQKDNLEYDLRTTDWILEKVRNNEAYAQNLYAAMCNNEFQRIDLWPILTDKFWSCSWRYAGGIVANMRQEGDYIDWYCSGINNGPLSDEDKKDMTPEAIQKYNWYRENFVSESAVTDEIAEDLKKLGWNVSLHNSAR
jgi:hypothetical protein